MSLSSRARPARLLATSAHDTEPHSPSFALDLVLHDLTVVGILSASPGLVGTIEHYADGRVDPRPLVAATVGLAGVGDALAGLPLPGLGIGPKIQIDPRL